MTSTLLTHEWLRTRSLVGATFALATLLVVVASGLVAMEWPLLATLGMILGVVVVGGLTPVTQILLAADYWRSSYGKTGYFTHAIPVKGSRIYWSKFLWAVIVTLISLVVTVILGALLWFAASPLMGGERTLAIDDLRQAWTTMTETVPMWLIVGGAFAFVAMYLLATVTYYFAISLGHEGWINRLGVAAPILILVGAYVVFQIAAFLGTFAIPVGVGMDGDRVSLVQYSLIADMRGDLVGEANRYDSTPIGYIVPMIVMAALMIWRTVHSWNRKVALT